MVSALKVECLGVCRSDRSMGGVQLEMPCISNLLETLGFQTLTGRATLRKNSVHSKCTNPSVSENFYRAEAKTKYINNEE